MKKSELRKDGLKVTVPRAHILKLLENSDNHHMSAEEIYQRLKSDQIDVGVATVYRVLTQFEEAGIVTRHNFEGGHSVFELDQGEHHDHLVCIICGAVAEFVDSTIEERQKSIADEHGYEMSDHSLTIYGKCSSCQPK